MNRYVIQMLGFSLLMIITISVIQNPYTTDYIRLLKHSTMTAVKEKPPLYVEIEEKKAQYEIAPQDAKIDSVWQAIPGLNGLKVNVEASYKNMEEEGIFNPKKLVFEEVPPTVTLQDLPPSPIYRGHPEKPMVSFLINVAWGNEFIPPMLKMLEKQQVQATFFLEGQWVKKYPDLAKLIVDAGHEIGNHAYTHPDMKTLTRTQIQEEIVKTNEIIKATTGQMPKWFAPPSGSYNKDVVAVAAEENMRVILWTVDTIDWKNPDPYQMVDRVAKKIEAGSMILMHPTASTATGLERMIKIIKKKEYQIVNLSTLLSEKRMIEIE